MFLLGTEHTFHSAREGKNQQGMVLVRLSMDLDMRILDHTECTVVVAGQWLCPQYRFGILILLLRRFCHYHTVLEACIHRYNAIQLDTMYSDQLRCSLSNCMLAVIHQLAV